MAAAGVTALAERAMGARERREQDTATCSPGARATRAINLPRPFRVPPDPAPPAEEPRWEVTMRERLVGEKLKLKRGLLEAFSPWDVGGELELELKLVEQELDGTGDGGTGTETGN